MMNKKTEQLKTLITKPMTAIALVIAATVVAATIACGGSETVVQTVVVEKSVPGQPVLQTVIVEKEVSVPGETVVQTVIVEKRVEVAGETLVEKGSPGAPGAPWAPGPPGAPGMPVPTARPAGEAAAATAPQPPVATVIVEKEIVKEVVVEVEVEKIVEAEAMTAAPAATAASHSAPTPVVKTSPPSSPSQSSQPGATTFQNTTRSNFALTSQDDTSTFSLDTDRTSFQLALNWTRAGYEVDPASVRAEEWINAFNYGYEMPRHDDSFNIQTDILAHPLDNGLYLARVAFQAPDIVVDLPLNVTLVLDGSGSMSDGNRVEIARTAAETIRTSLGRDDRMSIVHFDNNVKRGLTVEDDDPGSTALRNSIRDLHPDGGTNVQAGLNQGVQLADEMRRQRPNAYNYVILMSDGVANVDATNPFAILETARDDNPSNPIRLITIGVGIANYNDVLLEQLAQHGNGWYRYLSSPDEGRMLFDRDNWLALSVPFADQTRAQVVWDEEHVRSWRMIGYENRVTSDESFTRAEKKFAELPAGAATTVFFELELVDPYVLRNGNETLGNVEVRWVTPNTGEGNRQHREIDAALSNRDSTTDFGAIVALAADRYSGRHEYGSDHPGSIHNDLSDLQTLLRSLGSPISGTDAYNDFEFVLDSLVGSVQPVPRTGYSR